MITLRAIDKCIFIDMYMFLQWYCMISASICDVYEPIFLYLHASISV